MAKEPNNVIFDRNEFVNFYKDKTVYKSDTLKQKKYFGYFG